MFNGRKSESTIDDNEQHVISNQITRNFTIFSILTLVRTCGRIDSGVIPSTITTKTSDKSSGKSEIRENEPVLGLSISGESRAYPINMHTGPQREIVNDTLGGTAIAATW